jgi:competence protein ComFB
LPIAGREEYFFIIRRASPFDENMSICYNGLHEGDMDFSIKNANYERVAAVTDRFVKERYREVCSCPQCLNDIAALALNYLPPHYYVEREEKKEIGSPWLMVETAVVEAIDRVMENPHHARIAESPHSAGSPGLVR